MADKKKYNCSLSYGKVNFRMVCNKIDSYNEQILPLPIQNLFTTCKKRFTFFFSIYFLTKSNSNQIFGGLASPNQFPWFELY